MEEFETDGPFSNAVSVSEAQEFIAHMRDQLAQLKLNETNIRRGLNIFKIDHPPSHLIVTMEKVRIVENQSILSYLPYPY